MAFDQAKADLICARLSEGEPLAKICRDKKAEMPSVTTVWTWQQENPAFAERVARARVEGHDAIAVDALEISDDGRRDYSEPDEDGRVVVDHDHIQRAKLRVDTRLKLLACWDPKRYGAKLQTDNDTRIEVTIRDLSKENK